MKQSNFLYSILCGLSLVIGIVLFFTINGGNPNVFPRETSAIAEEGTVHESLYNKLVEINAQSGTVAMIGDSITAGDIRGRAPYFEPFQSKFPNITFENYGVSGDTTYDVLDRMNEINKTADFYIIAVGTNDVRRNTNRSANSGEEYIENIEKIVETIGMTDLALISPWPSFDGDYTTHFGYHQRNVLMQEFNHALEEYTFENQFMYIDTYSQLQEVIDWGNRSLVLTDFIHPNDSTGMQLYADAVLYGNLNRADYGLNETIAEGNYLYRIEILDSARETFTLNSLEADVDVLDSWTNNFNQESNAIRNVFGRNESTGGFSNRANEFPIDITFSTNLPITYLRQAATVSLTQEINYRIYSSTTRAAIVDLDHPSWEVIYDSNGLKVLDGSTVLYE